MKIIMYCQHVLGIGHLFRAIEICNALEGHDVVFVTGGPRVAKILPGHVREAALPELQMDREFKRLFSTDPHATLERVKETRRDCLFALFEKEAPDVFIIELYPFGRKAFRFELDPILEAIRNQRLPACKVVCSVRDILVEKQDQGKHESRAVRSLNTYFDAVLVHSDPRYIRIDETFSLYDQIATPVVYTGFIAPRPLPNSRITVRTQLGISEDEMLIVASAGSGSVGSALLESVINAFKHLKIGSTAYLRVFTGPFIGRENFMHLASLTDSRIGIAEFAPDFLSYLTAADLSISMAGYNTSMNILAARVPALVWPFSENREQRLRAERLASLGALGVLRDKNLQPERLAAIMAQTLSDPPKILIDVDLDGAAHTAGWIAAWAAGRSPR